MFTNWAGLNPFAVTQGLVLLTLLSCGCYFGSDLYLLAVVKRHWKLISLLVLMVIIWRIPIGNHFFHGFEYEDSYVYTVSARGLVDQQYTPPEVGSVYLVSVCSVGS